MSIKKHVLFVFLTSCLSIFSANAQDVAVMSYNIRFDNPADGVNAWPARKEKVFALLKQYDADIVGLQEAMHNQLQDILKALPEYAFVGVGRNDGKESGEFSAILYKKAKYTIQDQNTFWLSQTPEVPGSKNWDAALTRVATWIKIKENKSGKTFFVMNTHFDHVGKEARRESARLLKEKGKAIAANSPLIVTGDFNCTREEDTYKVLMSKEYVQLSDTAPANPPGTFCSFKVNSITCTAIDYIFHTNQFSSSGYKVIQDNDGTYYPSDHLPVFTRLTLR